MNDDLRFPREKFKTVEYEAAGKSIVCRAYLGLKYCGHPADDIQKLNIFVPEAYYSGGSIGPYNRENAPIFMPNTVGGYLPGPADEPGEDRRSGEPNSIFKALEHGYVVVSAGVRGRTTGTRSNEFFEGSSADSPEAHMGKKTGRAPAFIVDYKAAIRYLRHNRDLVLGDTERIITNGTSAGGALSALAGASGNSSDYEPYLREIGAAEERDDIFAASCYCPIIDLENADAAYEWQFCGQDTYHHVRFVRTEDGIRPVDETGELTDEQKKISLELKRLFPSYVNSLGLRGPFDMDLTLEENGDGSFFRWVRYHVINSAEAELVPRMAGAMPGKNAAAGSEIKRQDYFLVRDGHIEDMDWGKYIEKITRMKTPPAFDGLDLSTGENEEFGDENTDGRHFTAFSMQHSHVPGAESADDNIIRMMNPIRQIRSGETDVARYWRIRHGTFDRDTSLAVPVILATLLDNSGYSVDFKMPWGLPHSGDYDLDELFRWIDDLVLR